MTVLVAEASRPKGILQSAHPIYNLGRIVRAFGCSTRMVSVGSSGQSKQMRIYSGRVR